ncbi:hypothetical protein D3C78_1214530 [compost metagenome]
MCIRRKSAAIRAGLHDRQVFQNLSALNQNYTIVSSRKSRFPAAYDSLGLCICVANRFSILENAGYRDISRTCNPGCNNDLINETVSLIRARERIRTACKLHMRSSAYRNMVVSKFAQLLPMRQHILIDAAPIHRRARSLLDVRSALAVRPPGFIAIKRLYPAREQEHCRTCLNQIAAVVKSSIMR